MINQIKNSLKKRMIQSEYCKFMTMRNLFIRNYINIIQCMISDTTDPIFPKGTNHIIHVQTLSHQFKHFSQKHPSHTYPVIHLNRPIPTSEHLMTCAVLNIFRLNTFCTMRIGTFLHTNISYTVKSCIFFKLKLNRHTTLSGNLTQFSTLSNFYQSQSPFAAVLVYNLFLECFRFFTFLGDSLFCI